MGLDERQTELETLSPAEKWDTQGEGGRARRRSERESNGAFLPAGSPNEREL